MKAFIRWFPIVVATLLATSALAQTVLDSPELYPGEKVLYEAAKKEGLVVSFDTGPTWANWAAEFAAFKKRYPEVEIVFNDIGSGATVVALDKARNRPQADTAYYFAASAIDATAKDLVAPFKPVNFDKLPAVFRAPDGKWFTIHTLTITLVVHTMPVKNVPQSRADPLKPEDQYANWDPGPRPPGGAKGGSFAATRGPAAPESPRHTPRRRSARTPAPHTRGPRRATVGCTRAAARRCAVGQWSVR